MGNEQRDTIAKRHDSLPPTTRALFLSACIEHVVEACNRVGSGFEADVRDDCVGPTIAVLRSDQPPAADAVQRVIDSCDELIETGGDSTVNSLLCACVAAVETITGKEPMKFVMNNLDAIIEANDPEEEEDAELPWRLRLLDVLERGDIAAVEPLVKESLDWERRWRES